MKKIIIAITALTLGFGAYTLPAFAQVTGYTQAAPVLPHGASPRDQLFERIDRDHKKW